MVNTREKDVIKNFPRSNEVRKFEKGRDLLKMRGFSKRRPATIDADFHGMIDYARITARIGNS